MAEDGATKAGHGTQLAQMRTRLAVERTLDAWGRTALSMIGFGFTIAKFLQEFEKNTEAL